MEFTGIVVPGKKRGKQLGYPTANVEIKKNNNQGIYISQTQIDLIIYQSVSFLGNAKTFNETEIILETYILDFDQDIYGKEITVELLKKIRDNEKFESINALVKKMEHDVLATREYFKNKK